MATHHGRDRGPADRGDRRALALALLVNTAFLIVELIGAQVADSLVLFADAVHMLTDSASLGLALFAAWVATRPPDARRTYGYHRAEVLGALANGIFLVVLVGYVLYEAYRRFQAPRTVDPTIVIVVGVAGLAANLAAAYVLLDHRDALNVEGAFLHLLADAAGSVGAIAAGVIILLTGTALVDPLFALLIAALVLYSVRGLLVESVNILLQGTPRDVDVEEVAAALRGVDGVVDAHHVHVWALDSRRNAVSAHVVAAPEADATTILERSRRLLGERFDIGHATVQIESAGRSETVAFDCYPVDG